MQTGVVTREVTSWKRQPRLGFLRARLGFLRKSQHMNVLFIYSQHHIQSVLEPLENPELIYFGISYISSVLKESGHHTSLVVLSRISGKKNRKIIDEKLKSFKPELICFSAVASEYAFISDLAKYIKKSNENIYLMIGGPHVSLQPENVLLNGFDALCIGEGEYPTLELIEQLKEGKSPSKIPNLWIKRGLEIEKNPPRPFIRDLDTLPFPDRDIWEDWIEQKEGRCSVLLGRGCPFRCSYCSNHALGKLASGAYVRLRSPDNIVEEIKIILEKHPDLKEIYLEVETLGVNKKWAIKLCSKLEQLNASLAVPISYGTNIRITPNADLEELFSCLQKSNFTFINIGLESGSERVRNEILNRKYSNQDIINAVSLARKYGMKISLLNMLGLPGETLDDFKKTVEVNRQCLPDWTFPSIYYPYPGTDLYSLCIEKGLLKDNVGLEVGIERKNAALDLPGFSKKQIQKSYTWFLYDVYRGVWPTHKILLKVIKTKLMSYYFISHYYRKMTPMFLRRFMQKFMR